MPLSSGGPPRMRPPTSILLDFLVDLVLAAERAELLQLDPLGGQFLVLGVRVVLALALGTLKRNNFARHVDSPISRCRSRFRRPPCGRLRESRSAAPCPSPPA